MWVRVGSFAVKPGQAAALAETYNGVAVPKVRACAGSVGCLLIEPVAPDTLFTVITIWQTRAAAEAYEASGTAAEVVGLVKGFFAGPPTLRAYEMI